MNGANNLNQLQPANQVQLNPALLHSHQEVLDQYSQQYAAQQIMLNQLSGFQDPLTSRLDSSDPQSQVSGYSAQGIMQQQQRMRKESSNTAIMGGPQQILTSHGLVIHLQQPQQQTILDQLQGQVSSFPHQIQTSSQTQSQIQHQMTQNLQNLMPIQPQQSHPSLQQVLEPFASQIYSYSGKSEILSRSVSNKNSFCTDDSQTAHNFHNLTNFQQDQQQSMFTRQSTTKTAKNVANSNNNGGAGLKTLKENQIESDEEIELFEKELDEIQIPKLTFDQFTQIQNSCILTLDLHSADSHHTSPTVSEQSSSDESDGNSILNASLHSFNLGSVISTSNSPFIPSNTVSSQNQDNCPIIQFGNSIWSHSAVTSQTLTNPQNSQQVQQQHQTLEIQQQQKLLNDINSSHGNYNLPQNLPIQQQIQVKTQPQQQQQIVTSPIQTMINQQHHQILLQNTQDLYDQSQQIQHQINHQQQNLQLIPQLVQPANILTQQQQLITQPILLPPSQIAQQTANIQQQMQLQQLINHSQGQIQTQQDLQPQQIQQQQNDLQAQNQAAAALAQQQQQQQQFIQMQQNLQQQHQIIGMQQMHQAQVQNQHQLVQGNSPNSHHSHHHPSHPAEQHDQQILNIQNQQNLQHHDPNMEHNVQLSHLYLNRQINRHMLNPLYKLKSHKFETQNSFHRTASPSPMFFLPGNLSALKPPPGFENIVPQNIMNSQIINQIMAQSHLDNQQKYHLIQSTQQQQQLQQQQLETGNQQQPQIIGLIQPIPNSSAAASQLHYQLIHQQQLQQAQNQMQHQQHFQQQIQNQVLQQNQQQQQQQHQQVQQLQQHQLQQQQQFQHNSGKKPSQNPSSSNLNQSLLKSPQSVMMEPPFILRSDSQNQHPNYYNAYTSFFGEQVQTKKSELDEQLKKTTQHLEKKLIEQLEMQKLLEDHKPVNPGETDQDEDEEEEEDLDALSIKSDTQSQIDEEFSGLPENNKEDDEDHKSLLVSNFGNSSSSQNKQKSCSNHNSEHNLLKQQVYQQKTELYNKLKEQLNQIKNEMFSVAESPQNFMNPFKQDPSKYLEKILSLVTIFNEVDSQNSLAKLKTKYDKTKMTLEKVREQKLKFFQSLTSVNSQLHDLENNYQTLMDENNFLRDKQQQEREQLEFIIKSTYEKIREIAEKGNIDLQNLNIEDFCLQYFLKEGSLLSNSSLSPENLAYSLQPLLNEQPLCQKQIKPETSEKSIQCEPIRQDPVIQQNVQSLPSSQRPNQAQLRVPPRPINFQKSDSAQLLEEEKNDEVRQDFCKKITEQQIEIENLRDYIKQRSKEESQKRYEDKQKYDSDLLVMKKSIEELNLKNEQTLKEKDVELRLMKDHILRLDPDYFNRSLFANPDRIKECLDCKKRDQKILDLENRAKELTDYIKKNKDVKSSTALFQNQITPEEPQSQSNVQTQQVQVTILSVDLLSKLEILLDVLSIKFEANIRQDYKTMIQEMRLVLEQKNDENPQELKKQSFQQQNSINKPLEEIKEEANDDEQSSSSRNLFSKQYQSIPTIKDSVNDIIEYLKSEVNFIQENKAISTINEQKETQNSSQSNQNQDQKSAENEFFTKLQLDEILSQNFKDQLKISRKDRQQVHQVIVEVEKLMYQMNSLFITEQMCLEQIRTLSTDEYQATNNGNQKIFQTQSNNHQSHLERRIYLNGQHRELFSLALETYLQLPLKLKPIFDKMKSLESFVGKIYKNDSTILYEIARKVFQENQDQFQAYSNKEKELEKVRLESEGRIKILNDEKDLMQNKIQQLNEKLVQVNSAYNAVQKHLGSSSTDHSRRPSISSTQSHREPQQVVSTQSSNFSSNNNFSSENLIQQQTKQALNDQETRVLDNGLSFMQWLQQLQNQASNEFNQNIQTSQNQFQNTQLQSLIQNSQQQMKQTTQMSGQNYQYQKMPVFNPNQMPQPLGLRLNESISTSTNQKLPNVNMNQQAQTQVRSMNQNALQGQSQGLNIQQQQFIPQQLPQNYQNSSLQQQLFSQEFRPGQPLNSSSQQTKQHSIYGYQQPNQQQVSGKKSRRQKHSQSNNSNNNSISNPGNNNNQ